MPGREDINIHSEELQEVFGTPPRWLVRWGTTIAFFAFAAMIAIAYYVKYPDTVQADITIVAPNPPVPIFAKSIETIDEVKVENDSEVEPGQIILIYSSTANPRDIDTLEKDLKRFVGEVSVVDIENFTPRRNLQLGSIQDQYSSFIKDYDDFIYGTLAEIDVKSINRLYQEIAAVERSIEFESEKRSDIIIRDTVHARETKRVRKLYIKEPDKYRNTINDLAEEKRAINMAYKNLETTISDKRREIQKLENRIADIRQEAGVDNSKLITKIVNDISVLQGSIKAWKNKHIVRAPIGGRLVFSSIFENENQSVQEGEKILEIIPPGEIGEVYGKVDLPIEGSGKVERGQPVVIKIKNYPFHEYGILKGVVRSKSDVQQADGETFKLEVELNNALLTSKGVQLKFTQGMEGTAEIITREERFLIRMFENVFDL